MVNAPYNPAGGKTYTLSGSISSTATTFTLASFIEPVTGTPYTMALLNTQIVFGTIAPKTTSSEFISFTGIIQNANGTATLTGVTRGLAKKYPFTTDSAYKLAHSGQTPFILSDAPQVFQEYVPLNNDATVGGLLTFLQTPVGLNPGAVQDSSTTVKGIGKISVAPVSSTNPIFVGDNDPRVTTPLVVSLGGTGKITLTANAILTAGTTSTGALQQLGLGTTTQVLHGNAAGLGTFGAVVLTTDVSGILPVANGGTGTSTFSAGSNLLFQSSSTVSSSVANTSENTLITNTIPANSLGTANALRWRLKGTITMGGNSQTITIRTKYGGVTAWSTAITTVASGTVSSVNIDLEGMIFATGATNTQKGTGFMSGNNTITTVANTGLFYIWSQGTPATPNADSTTTQALALTTQLGATTNAPTLDITSYTVEILR